MNASTDLTGKLDFLNLGEILQLLGSSSSSGVLRIKSKYAPDPGVVYIEKGNPIDATVGSQSGIEALFSLFGWIDGQFEFIRETVSPQKRITKSRMEIILDGLRLLDEGKIKKLGPISFEQPAKSDSLLSAGIPTLKGPLVDYTCVLDEEGFREGDEIVREGNHGNWIWVILEGVVEIVKESSRGPVKVLRVSEGAFLGSIASLLAMDNVRSATVVAATNVQLGMLDSQFLASELANLSPDFRDLIKSLDERLRRVTAMAAEAYWPGNQILELTKNKRPIIKQGQPEERLFIIRDGDAYVVRETENGLVPLAQLHKGDYLGRIPFLDLGHEPYSASVYATPNLKVGLADSEKIQTEHRSLSSTLKNIFDHLAASISVTSVAAVEFQKRSSSTPGN